MEDVNMSEKVVIISDGESSFLQIFLQYRYSFLYFSSRFCVWIFFQIRSEEYKTP